MAIIPDIVLDAMAEPGSIKMVGTVDQNGQPNVVILSTIAVLDLETIGFADLKLGTTKTNLHKNGKLTLFVLSETGKTYQMKCSFVTFDNKSEIYDRWFNAVWQKMAMQLKGVAIAKVIKIIQD